ncbi:MAG: SpoIVB peptidase [Bacilli bacterium]|nr:SpoIVB peptidase [Bacilli bacterium]
MKRIKKIIVGFFILLAISLSVKVSTYANNDKMVYLGGENIGIKLNTGVTVMGKYEVDTINGKFSPWKESNIEVGDVIISINNLKISDNNSLLNILSNVEEEVVSVELLRNNQKIRTDIFVCKTIQNQKSLGLYIKDKILGVGTLTFVDVKSNRFASLGHGIYQNNKLFDSKSGLILGSNVDEVIKAVPGDAGEIRSTINNKVLGYITNNKNTGLYGKGIKKNNRDLIEIADINEVKLGKAQIVTTLTNNQKEKYDIEIIELQDQSSVDIKGIKIRITDPKLLNITGGIVQGMSGSPIIQDGKLVGAVSHVIVDNPTVGYGIYAKWMLKDANI